MTYKFGPFTLHSGPLVLLRDGGLVPLPPRALELLLFLLERQGKIVSKDEILRGVWRDTHVVESSLTKYISILRKAIDNPEDVSYIENLSKRGYRFVASPTKEGVSERKWRVWVLASALAIILSLSAYFLYRPKPSPLSHADIQVLIGRNHWNRIRPDELTKALKRFELAASIDPASALPFAGIADSNLLLANFGFKDPELAIAAARSAVASALKIDPNLPSPHLSACLLAFFDLDWVKAEQELAIVHSLDPNSAAFHRGWGLLHTFRGDLTSARKSFKLSLAVDPLSAWTSVSLAKVEYFDHQFDQALTMLNDLLDREPDFSLALYYRALTLAYLGRTQEALQDLHKTGLNQGLIASDEAWILARGGNPSPARNLLAKRVKLWREAKALPVSILILAVSAGETTIALEAIEAFARKKGLGALNLKIDPRFDPLRNEPAFIALLARLRAFSPQ